MLYASYPVNPYDLTPADKAAVRRHLEYLTAEPGAVSLVATLPDAGECTIDRDGRVLRENFPQPEHYEAAGAIEDQHDASERRYFCPREPSSCDD